MAERISKVYLAKDVRVDRDYKNVVNLSENNFLEGVIKNSNHLVASFENMSLIGGKDSNIISLGATYETCIKANYIAFQNPSYSNKWFFAWIDKVEIRADKTQYIHFTVDIWTTWWDYWTATACFVEREHVADDTPGLHTIPEGLETGEYITNSVITDNTFGVSVDNLCYILASTTSWRTKTDPFSDAVPQPPNGGGRYHGVYSGCKYYRFDVLDQVTGRIGIKDALTQMADAGQIDNVVGIFVAPKFLAPYKGNSDVEIETTNHEVAEILLPSTSGRIIGNQTIVGGYEPHNKKVLTFPYNYLRVTNGNGNHAIYHYEDFIKNGQNGLQNSNIVDFQVDGSLCPGCSCKLSPRNYRTVSVNYDEGMSLGKYPIASFQTDMYTNWLTQNSINIPSFLDGVNSKVSVDDMSMFNSLIGTVGSIASGSVGGTISGFNGIASAMITRQQHSLIAPQSTANNVGDVVTALGLNTPQYHKLSIKREYAEIIDQFFTKFGYQVNKIKVPNIVNRPYWNYVKIGQGEKVAFSNGHNNVSVPDDVLSQINSICQTGVTIWHQHGNVGNFALENWN